MSFVRRQRAQLIDLMREVGPFADTKCEGWQVQDLAAHLWIREHRPSALPGIGFEAFAGRTERIQQESLHSKGFLGLLEELQRPPWYMRPMDRLAGGVEWYIHHEDVRRARGEKVRLTAREVDSLESIALVMAKKAQRESGAQLVVTPRGSKPRTLGTGDRTIFVEGPANELLLHFTGRDSDVTVTGDDVEAYRESLKGL